MESRAAEGIAEQLGGEVVMATRILVDRLDSMYQVFEQLELPRNSKVYAVAMPCAHHRYDRNINYDIGRVRYFKDAFIRNEPVDPISIDCLCANSHVYPYPVLLDGHHRLCGAILARAVWIPATFGGRVDLLRYLQGKRKTAPQE